MQNIVWTRVGKTRGLIYTYERSKPPAPTLRDILETPDPLMDMDFLPMWMGLTAAFTYPSGRRGKAKEEEAT